MLRRLWLVGSSGRASEHRTLLSVVSSLVEQRDNDAGYCTCGVNSDSVDHTGVPDLPSSASALAPSDLVFGADADTQTGIPSCDAAYPRVEKVSCSDAEVQTDTSCRADAGAQSEVQQPVEQQDSGACWKPKHCPVLRSVEQQDSGVCWKPKHRPAVEPQPEQPWRPWNCLKCGGCVAVPGQAASFKRSRVCLACGGSRLLCRPHREGRCVHCHGYSERLCADCRQTHCCGCKEVVVAGNRGYVAPAAPRVDTAVKQITAADNSEPSGNESCWQPKCGKSRTSFGHDPTPRTKPRAKLRPDSSDTAVSTAATSTPSAR